MVAHQDAEDHVQPTRHQFASVSSIVTFIERLTLVQREEMKRLTGRGRHVYMHINRIEVVASECNPIQPSIPSATLVLRFSHDARHTHR